MKNSVDFHFGTLQWYQSFELGSACEVKIKKIEEVKIMQRMRFISSVFRSSKDLSKEVEKTEKGEEEGPCTSYSHQGGKMEHEKHLKFEIIGEYLAEYRENPRSS